MRHSPAPETLIQLYAGMLKPRMIEEKMLLLLRQGKISKWFSGIGQEAISVGSTMAMEPDEYVLPLHRNLGVFTARGLPLERLFAQFQGKKSGYTKGRDRSFHFGAPDHRIVGMISHLGPQLSVADGIALAHRLEGEARAVLVFTGEGGTSQGEFHEALNVASVWGLPVIFLIENNGYGLSTPTGEQYRCERLMDRAAGYGMEGVQIDGNDVAAVHETVRGFAEAIRLNPRPVLIEAMTFRMRGHEEASGTKYVPAELFEEWKRKDPVTTFEERLLATGVLTRAAIESARAEIQEEIDRAIEITFGEPDQVADETEELGDVYAPVSGAPAPPGSQSSSRRFVDAVSDGLREGLRRHPRLVVMGQDVAEYGGVFKVTEGFLDEFGRERIRNTPLCESAIVGAALGLSVRGFKSVVEMQFSDFVSCAFTQIVNNLAKVYYRWGQNADVVIRMPTGAGVGAGPFHSQSTEGWFTHVPGLKVVYPATPADAKGLLLAALADPNPVLFYEHKALYRSIEGAVPEGYYTVPIGRANVVREGEQLTIITYGLGVHWALKALAQLPDISARVLDLRTLLPLDYDAIRESVERTSRVLVLHEATKFGGIGGEIAAYIAEHCFHALDAPIERCAGLDTPVPFSGPLEKQFLAVARLEGQLRRLAEY